MPRVLRAALVVSLVVLLLGLVVYLALSARARPRPGHPFLERGSDPLVIAHQGGDGLWPSNTLYAFERAVALGVDALELDLHRSSDGAFVVIHDATVDRTTDGTGAVADLSAAELGRLDAGYDWSPERLGESFPYRGRGLAVPTLEAVFAAFPEVRMVLELKPDVPEHAPLLCDLIRQHGRVESVLVGSFHDPVLAAFRAECPEVATSAGPNEVRTLFVLGALRLGALYRPRADALQVPERQGGLHLVTERFLAAAGRKNVAVQVWTVNDAEDMARLLALGVDGLITDRPDRLLRLLGREVADARVEGVPE